jgi:hypothetical protein
MILLRPANPDEPIVITNAVEVDLDEPPAEWVLAAAAYMVESTNVEVSSW